MNFNDLTVKLTNNKNYQSLQANKKEQINALIKDYERYANDITTSFFKNLDGIASAEKSKREKEEMWGTILNFGTLGAYPITKGVINGLTDLVVGVVGIGTQLVNNIGQVFDDENRFGDTNEGFWKEVGADLIYTIMNPVIDVATGLTSAGLSVKNIIDKNDEQFNKDLDFLKKMSNDTKSDILNMDLGFDTGGSLAMVGVGNNDSKKDLEQVGNHTYDWARDFSTSMAQGGDWFKKNVTPVASQILTLGIGKGIDELGMNEAGMFFNDTMESIGRMIPAIVATYLGKGSEMATAISQTYFFSSSFGSGFTEAISRGATLEEAYNYAYGMASIETLTEQIGGFQIGKVLPKKAGTSAIMNIISAGIAEGLEEVMSEAGSAGLEGLISDDMVTNKDFMERAMMSFLGGAISGGIFGVGGQVTYQKSAVGKVNSLNNEVKRIYEGQNQDYGKAQQVFNKKVDRLLNSYNKDSVLDNNLIEEGKRTPETRKQAKKDLLEKSGFASLLIEYNEESQKFQLTKKGIEMTTNLEGHLGKSNKNAYSSTLYGLEDGFIVQPTNEQLNEEQQQVMNLAKKTGSEIVFFDNDDTNVNGFFDSNSGVIYLNTKSKKSHLINFVHELTHSLEGTKSYLKLRDFIMSISDTNGILKAKMEELGLTKQDIVKSYWGQISSLENMESRVFLMSSEYVAFAMSEVILKDAKTINELTKNKTIGRKILNWIKGKIADIKTPKTDIEKAFLKDLKQAKDLYEEALGLGYRKGLKISEVDKRFSFIGEMGIENYITYGYIKDSGLDSVAKGLKDAKEMFDNGFNNQEILEKTGWYFSKDGNWKFEISDKEVSVKKEFETKLKEIIEDEGVYAFDLSEILDNDKLYKLYPSLKRLDVYITFEKGEDYYGYFSPGNRNKIVLNLDALIKDKQGDEIKKNLESYKKDLKTLEEIKEVFDTDKNKAIELSEKLETGNNIQFASMIFEKNESDFKAFFDSSSLFISFTRDINGIDFLIKSTEINIKSNEELLKTMKKVDGENFILPTLLHEIQHYIQTVELWSDGGNLKDGFIYIIQDFLRKNKMVESFNEMSEYDRREFLLETFKNYPIIAQKFHNYLMFLGEVEARTVEKNRTLSQEEINNAKDISHEDNAVVKDSLIEYLNPLDNFYYSLAMKEMLLGFNEFERPNILELENNKDIYDDELKKSLDKAIDFYNSDVRYSLKIGDNEVIVDTKSINNDLVALHNIGEDKLIKIIELGGFPMPSIAITKPNMNHEGYGDITVIFDKDTIDPKKTTKNKVWSGDKWTATFPQIEYEIDKEFIRKLGEETGLEVFDRYGDRVERMLKNYGLEGTVESIASNPDAKEYFEKNPPKNGLTVEEYLTEVIGNAILNTGIRNNVEIFTNAGNRRSFSQTHYTVSLENILKSMISSETKKGVFYGGIGSMSASNMKNYRSINEIKKDIWKIVDENTTNAQKIELENQLLDVVSDILDNKKHVDKNRFIALDNAEAILRELGGDGVNKTNIEKWYKEYEINGSEELTNKIINLFENLRNKYVRYFESKPERIVNFSEIKNVLLPEKTQQKLINLLNENNIPYEMYGKEGRKTHIENMKDIRFSKTTDSEGRKLTIEQEKYFKDSKVRDKQGNLLVMYHGSSSGEFNIFDSNKIGENFPSYSAGGFYFTNKKQTAEYYGRKGHIKEVYLNLENPHILKANEDWYNGSDWFDINPQQHYEQAIQNGNDGIIVEQKYGNMVLAFESNQIKNINNLNPTSSEDIRYSRTTGSKGVYYGDLGKSEPTDNVGYHRGDLGKSEYFPAMKEGNRGTGHFGTGTYFTSTDSLVGTYSYGDRPLKKVSFDGYNLFKPKTDADGLKLHEGLKELNKIDGEESLESWLKETIDIDYDDDLEPIVKTKTVERIPDEILELKEVLGVSDEQFNKAIKKVKSYAKTVSYDTWDNVDSISTVFMKALGFEGIDVRHLKRLDNDGFGSVIYDLKKDLDIKISNEKIFSGNDERNTRIFTYGDGKSYDIDGGFISVIENSPYSPVNGNSIYDFFVNEEKRGKGIGTKLFQKALKEFDGKLSGQFSSEQSVKIAWKNGLRNSEYKTLDEALKAMKENSSVFLEIGYNLTSNVDVDIRFSRNVDNGIDNKTEMKILDKVIKNTYKNYNKKAYLDTIAKRQKSFNEINLKEISKTTNGKKKVKVIETLMTDYERIIKKNYNRSELYNHIFNNVIQEIILELSNNFGDTTFADKKRVVDNIESIVSQTMAYVDDTFNNNDVNKLNPKNPQGFQYTRLINWGFRELLDASTPGERNEVLKSKKITPLWDMIENIVKLDITNNQSILEFNAGIKNFFNKTRVEQVNTMALDSKGEFAHTIPNVLKQNDTHIENLIKLVGTMELQSKDGKKTTYKRTNGLLGNVRLFDKLSGTRLDMFAFGNIFGLFMEESTGSVMTNRIFEAQKQQLEVSNKFYEYFEKDGFLKKNRKNIDLLEQEVSSLTNLLDSNGNPIIIPNSEVIYLRNIMLREIIRDRMIENGYRGGEQSNHFKDGGFVFINGNSNNRKTNEANRVQAKITKVLDLFNELDSIVKESKFMIEYNQKILGFFEIMYEFENARNKDISGLELTNDKDTISNLTEEQRAKLTSGLNEVNIDSIYVPMRSVGSNKSSGAGAFNINNVIDLGIDDGMVMGITESNNPPLIDSINNIVPQYTRSVANFYGLFRVVNDLNILFNKEITLSDGSKITLADKVSKISPYIIPYYEKLLRDISGYGVNSDITSEGFNRFMGKIRRNFFKASLALNAKVISTQFASMFTIATVYGDFKGTKKSLFTSMMKNLFSKGSKTKAKYLIENSEIYKDRARNSTYEISEATSSAFNKSKFNEVTEFLMKGIAITDNMINRAFFISLVEHGYTEEQALKMTEEAITRYQSSGLSINKNELLRTQNELIKVFTKFLGEPMKVVSNMEESIKHLQIINRLEKNQEAINESFDDDLVESQKQLEDLEREKVSIENLINNEKDKAKKKDLEKTLKNVDKNIRVQEENVLEQEKNNAQIKKQVQGVIDGKTNTKKVLGKRVTALTLSVTWQALLGVAFSTLRTGGKDKDEDEEVWSYLGEKFGWQLANEAMGFLPFARDIYSLIIDKYDANVVSDFQAFNDLGISINGILTDMTNGGDFDYGKHIRKVSIHLGQILGIPTRQIERLFTTPSNYFMKSANYTYRDITGQQTTNDELTNAIKNGDDKLIETILNRRLDSKGVSLTNSVSKEINRLAKNGVVVNPSGIPNSFSIDGVEYKNNKDKFAETYNNATFVIEKVIKLSGYNRLDDEHKAKLIKAIYNYYYSLAKQVVSGVAIFTKERTYNMNQAYAYFKDRIPYYITLQQKEKKERAN